MDRNPFLGKNKGKKKGKRKDKGKGKSANMSFRRSCSIRFANMLVTRGGEVGGPEGGLGCERNRSVEYESAGRVFSLAGLGFVRWVDFEKP